MSKAITQRSRRTYFNNPLVEESLRHLPAAVEHPTSVGFRDYLVAHLPQSSSHTRRRFAEYISQRFSHDGQMNLALASAIKRFADSRTSREIFFFELLLSSPVLQEIASLWLAELPAEGAGRASLLALLERRLGGRNTDQVATAAVATFRRCRKLTSPKLAMYVPVWADPTPEAFFYVLARLYPERAMVRVDHLAGQPILRAMLWPRPCLGSLLESARRSGHVSKISELDQYHQFTLADSAEQRLARLFDTPSGPPPVLEVHQPPEKHVKPARKERSAKGTRPKNPSSAATSPRKTSGAKKGAKPSHSKTEPKQLTLLPREM